MISEFDIRNAEIGIANLLRALGEDPEREGIKDTPRRVVLALQEMTSGRHESIGALLKTTFDGGDYDEVIAVKDIDFVSLCEHHLLPFTGTCAVAYLPAKKGNQYRVVGLSKIPRVVDAFAHRLQLQEQMTSQIATALETHLEPQGVGVVIKATHACMSCRGVRKAGASMVTSAMKGLFRIDHGLRSEVLRLMGM